MLLVNSLTKFDQTSTRHIRHQPHRNKITMAQAMQSLALYSALLLVQPYILPSATEVARTAIQRTEVIVLL